MKYKHTTIDAITYELPPEVISSDEIEEQLRPLYEKLRMPFGQLEEMTGIYERRWWPRGYRLTDGAIAAGRKALERTGLTGKDLGALIYAGVCREGFEPATACRVAAHLGIADDAFVFDISNACLGVLNGMIDIANRIELGQLRAGMVVSAETAREVVEETIQLVLRTQDMNVLKDSFATFTGGSGAVAVILSDGSLGSPERRHSIRGGVTRTAPQHYDLCKWGLEVRAGGVQEQYLVTDAPAMLRNGIEIGGQTWRAFQAQNGWGGRQIDKVVCHQVGATNRQLILKETGLKPEQDFPTFPFLGNVGTVSLPITAAIGEERGHLQPGELVGFLGIGSGMNCTMLAIDW